MTLTAFNLIMARLPDSVQWPIRILKGNPLGFSGLG